MYDWHTLTYVVAILEEQSSKRIAGIKDFKIDGVSMTVGAGVYLVVAEHGSIIRYKDPKTEEYRFFKIITKKHDFERQNIEVGPEENWHIVPGSEQGNTYDGSFILKAFEVPMHEIEGDLLLHDGRNVHNQTGSDVPWNIGEGSEGADPGGEA